MITVYVADGCPFCQLLLADLQRRHVAFTLVNLSQTPERVRELASLTFSLAVPAVVDHERCTVGFAGGSTSLRQLGLWP